MNAHSYDYPDEPGHRGVDTSIEAANAIAPIQGRLQRMVLLAIQEAGVRGLTAQEIADRLGLDLVSVQPRTTELRRKHLIHDSGERRPNRRGNRSIVWVAVNSGGREHG